MTVSNSFDQLARRLAQSSHSRRATLGALGGGIMAALASPATTRPARAAAQDGSEAAPALDPETISNVAQALWLPPDTPFDELPPAVQDQLLDPRNSNAAFGERMRYYLQFLLDNPDSFTPDYTDRYRTLMDYAGELSAHQAYVMTGFIGKDRTNGYDLIPAAANFVFPDTNGMQLRSQVGWYFAVGSARDSAGNEYGIELMLFRTAILPPPVARQLGLSDAENQVLELQLAITRAGETHYQATPVIVAGTTGLLSFAEGAIGASLGNNAFTQLTPGQTFPLRIQGRGWDQTSPTPIELGIDITFSTGRDYLLQGDEGCLPCCGGVGTLYYSIPNLELDPGASTISIDGEEITLTSGSFWFDHQWTNGLGASNPRSEGIRALGNLSPEDLGGWDWFMAQFDDNRQITLAALHTDANRGFYQQDGPTAPGVMVAPAVGKLMDETGDVIDVAGTVTIDEWIRSESTPNPALYWPTYVWYPNHWQFDLTTGAPDDLRRFSMSPIVAGGQSAFFANGAQYSEGAVILRDDAGAEVGRGFAESVDYADTTLNKLALSGLPVTTAMTEALAPVPRSLALEAESAVYVATHRDEIEQEVAMCIGLEALAAGS